MKARELRHSSCPLANNLFDCRAQLLATYVVLALAMAFLCMACPRCLWAPLLPNTLNRKPQTWIRGSRSLVNRRALGRWRASLP